MCSPLRCPVLWAGSTAALGGARQCWAANHCRLPVQDEQLLGPFFDRWGDTTRALEVTCSGVNTDLCNEVIASRKITVLVYG